jgi:hypothetical protein
LLTLDFEAVALDIVRRPVVAGSHDLQYLRLAVARQRHVTDLLPKIACASGETCDNVPRDYTKGTNFCLVRAEEMTF